MSTVSELADELCDHFFPSSDRLSRIDQVVGRPGQGVFLTHYLNGPWADTVMESGDFRWITVKANDIGRLLTVEDMWKLCNNHIVPDPF